MPKNFIKRAQDLLRTRRHLAGADVQQAESDRSQAQADVESSADALRALGVADPDALLRNRGSDGARSRCSRRWTGEIVERLVGPGQLLQAGATQCFTISDTSTVWVLVNVYQSDLGRSCTWRRRRDHHRCLSRTFPRTISYIAPALDPTTRTLQARIVTENPGNKLKKDMYVTATVRAGAIANALLVPDAAVLRDTENQPFVYVQTGAEPICPALWSPLAIRRTAALKSPAD